MKFVCYTSWEQLPESASALFAQADWESLFFSRPWFECLTATALAADHRLVLACVLSGDKVMAVLPLMQCDGIKTWYSLRHGFTPIYNPLRRHEQGIDRIVFDVNYVTRSF